MEIWEAIRAEHGAIVAQWTAAVGGGARPREVLALVLRQGLKLALAGVGAGMLLAAGVARVLESMLYGVSAFDPLAYAAAALVLLAAATLANALPAYRASRIEPMRALRHD